MGSVGTDPTCCVGPKIADHLPMIHLQPKLLRRALEIAGSEGMLCSRLSAEPHQFKLWLAGRASAPAYVLHQVIDLIVEDDIARANQDRRARPRGSSGPNPH